jgi:hypothetical protein
VARAQALAGEALSFWGRLAEAHEQLAVATAVLRADPDLDTVRAVRNLAAVESQAGSADADRLSAEALSLGQALGVGDGELSRLFYTRGIYFATTDRHAEAAAYYRESARLASQAGHGRYLGLALLNLADTLGGTDPGAAEETARTAAGHLRRVGDRAALAIAIVNLAQSLVMLGDWDAAEAELTQAGESEGLTDYEFLACYRGWLAALRGDAAAAQTILAGLKDLRASEDPQDKTLIGLVEGFSADASSQPRAVLSHVRAILAYVDALGISSEPMRWAWPLAARAAHDLRDTAAVGELLTLLDAYQTGYLAPMLRAERDLARARLSADEGGPAAADAFASAISGLRELSTPYHLAHGLLDYVQHLSRLRDTQAAEAALGEARDIAGRLRCQRLLDRAAILTPARSAVPSPSFAGPDSGGDG